MINEKDVKQVYGEVGPEVMHYELAVAKILEECGNRGILVDEEILDKEIKAIADELDQVQMEINAMAGRPVKPGSKKDLGKLLFEEMKLPILMHTKKGAVSTNKQVLEKIDHPIAPLLIRWGTLRSNLSYMEGMKKALE